MKSTETISSLQNERIKHAVKLRKRSLRDKEALFIIEGYREIKRALDHGQALHELFICPDFFWGPNEEVLIQTCQDRGASVTHCTAACFSKMSYRDRPEGLLAIAPQERKELSDLEHPQSPLLLIAEHIEKPGNLGTMLRSADAAGADAVLVCDRCTDIYNPNVVRSSIGTLFSVPVVETSSEDLITWLRARKIPIIATSPAAEQSYSDSDLTGPVAFVLGTEQLGLSAQWMEAADLSVSIPMHGAADSLNVASSTAILLYEAVRQRRAAQD